MGLSPALNLIPDDAFDTSVQTPQYSSDFSSIVGNAGDDSDGFEGIFNVLGAHLADGPNFLSGLDGVLADLGNVGNPAQIPFEQDFADSVASTVSQGQPDFNAFAVHLTGDTPPPPGSGAGSGAGSSNTNCGGNNPLSTAGAFTGVKCDQKQIFRKLNVSAGPCSYSQAQTPLAGSTNWPRITSFTLTSGDPTVWRLSHHQQKFDDGSIVDFYDITVIPKLLPARTAPAANVQGEVIAPTPTPLQNPSHFDATAILVMTNQHSPQTICMSVDCIP